MKISKKNLRNVLNTFEILRKMEHLLHSHNILRDISKSSKGVNMEHMVKD